MKVKILRDKNIRKCLYWCYNYFLNYIKDFIKSYQNIELIDNKNIKGAIFSFSKGILASKGKYILLFQSSFILYKDKILFELYQKIDLNNLDILEFNLISNDDNAKIDINSLSLHKCLHMTSDINVDILRNNKLNLGIDQEKEILFNKIIRAKFLKNIIKKYNFISYKDVIFNYYDNILLYTLFNKNAKFLHIDIIGIIKNINNMKELRIIKVKEKKNQKIKDSIFYINFLYDNTEKTFKSKQKALFEFYNIFSIIYNKNNKISKDSINLLIKFNNSKYINISDKIDLNFYYSSLIN